MRDIMKMNDQELKDAYFDLLKDSQPGIVMYAEEIGRRASAKTNKTLVCLTWGVLVMTGFVVVLTIALLLFSKAPAV